MEQFVQQQYFKPFPTLTTTRLLLRQLVTSDDEALFALRSDPAINKYLDRDPPKSIEDVQAHIKRINDGIAACKSLYWIICPKDSLDLIGTICLWNLSADLKEAEIGYELLTLFQGKGFMDEAVKEIIRFGFEVMNLEIIYAYTHKLNDKSSRLLVNNQFLPHPELKDKENENIVVYFLKNDFFY